MSYLSQPTSKLDYGVFKVGNYIDVIDGVVSLSQDLSANASPVFANVNVAGNLTSGGNAVVTSVTPTAGPGIILSNVITQGYSTKFTVTNSGVLNLTAGVGITLTANTGNVTISSTGTESFKVYGTTTNYTATPTDEYIGVYSAAAVTITLPLGIEGRVYYIKDEYGQGSGKITIQPQTGELVDGKTNYVISVPYQCVACVFRAGQWRLI